MTKASSSDTKKDLPQICLFTPRLKAIWAAIIVATVSAEVIPIPIIPPVPFYAYGTMKALLFLALGFLAPLTFWRFNALNRGLLLAVVSSSLVEGLQGLIQHGHNFHVSELFVKLLIIFAGFSYGIVSRYDRMFSLGTIRIQFIEKHS